MLNPTIGSYDGYDAALVAKIAGLPHVGHVGSVLPVGVYTNTQTGEGGLLGLVRLLSRTDWSLRRPL